MERKIYNIFSALTAYRFGTLLVVAGCHPFLGFVILAAKIRPEKGILQENWREKPAYENTAVLEVSGFITRIN